MTPGTEQLILARLDDLHDDVKEVKGLAEATNGRVRTLELWRATLAGMHLTFKAVPILVSVIAGSASLIALVLTLTNTH